MTERIRMTAAEFSQLSESNQITELIDGEVIVSPSPIARHQALVLNMAMLLRRFSGTTVIAPMDVYLDEVNVLQPDVFWLAENSACMERDGYFFGAPDIVVEVLSPATSTRDKRDKFAIYEAQGVQEYWLVDPAGDHVEVWQRQGDQFRRLGVFTQNQQFMSSALKQMVTLSEVF